MCELIGRVLGGAAHGELVHVELAQEDEAGLPQLRDHGGVIGGHVAFEYPRGAGGLHALHAQHVFETYRHPVPREPLTLRLGIDRAGGAERARLIHSQIGLHRAVHRSYAV